MKKAIEEQGYHIEKGLYSEAECRRLLQSIKEEEYLSASTWIKGCAVTIPSWASLVRHDRIVDRVAEILGDDIILWGADLVERLPGQVHSWHNDLESSGSDGFVSVWIGVKNTDYTTSLKIVPGSHKVEKLLLQSAQDDGVEKSAVTDQHIEKWSERKVEYLDTNTGDALFFDGRLWHASNNMKHTKIRYAVLLQYARADRAVRMPHFFHNRWPAVFLKAPKPPCLLVRGSVDHNGLNQIVPGAPMKSYNPAKTITTMIEQINRRDDEPGNAPFKSFDLLKGPSPDIREMAVHYSTLAPGQIPHPPHIHDEEEILIVVEGTAELLVEDAKGSNNIQHLKARPGDFIYYPGNWRHTIKNVSDEPILYLMFKWITDEYDSGETLERTFIRGSEFVDSKNSTSADQSQFKGLLEGKTAFLRKLHTHATSMPPNEGYAEHADSYDVGILLFDGQVETLGETVTAPALIYYASGEMHGMKSTGATDAKYIVFEFHGKHGDIYEHPKYQRRRKLKQSLTNPGILIGHLKWKVKRMLGR